MKEDEIPPFQLLKNCPRNRTIWAETWWKHSRDAQYRFVWCFTIYSGIRWKVRNWNTGTGLWKTSTMKSLLSYIKNKIKKNPNLENRIAKYQQPFLFGTKQNIMKILMYSIRIWQTIYRKCDTAN
jgi:hypothetical protein